MYYLDLECGYLVMKRGLKIICSCARRDLDYFSFRLSPYTKMSENNAIKIFKKLILNSISEENRRYARILF